MLNLEMLKIEPFIRETREAYRRNYGNLNPEYGDIIAWVGHLALENIANSDMLYHNVDHTIMVTLAGQSILRGRHLSGEAVAPREWLHMLVALLCHDIGYVQGVCQADDSPLIATGVNGHTVKLPEGGTDARLTPYHVDRSKLFVQERFGGNPVIDAQTVVSCIEATRVPVPDDPADREAAGYPGLVRAADYIGQLGDPNYLRKVAALYYEFEELGANRKMGYSNPGQMRRNYGQFYWKVVLPFISDGLRYLQVTQEGKQWIANLHSQVFRVEHDTADVQE